MKKAMTICLACMVLLTVAGCGAGQSADQPVEQPAEESAEQPVEEPVEQPAEEIAEQPAEESADQPVEESAEQKASEEDWKKIYQDYLESLKDNEDYKSAENNGFCLYDINKDDIPELIWDHADFSDHFSFLTCFEGSAHEFDTAGRRAVGYEIAWGVENTGYYIKEYDAGFTYSFSLCTIKNGEQAVLLSVNDTNDSPENDYTYPFVCRDENGNEISEEEFRDKFKELTGYEIGKIASDSEYTLSGESYIVDLLDPEKLISEEELKKSLDS